MLTGALRGTGDMLRPALITVLIVSVHAALMVVQRLAGAPFGLAGAAYALLAAYLVGLICTMLIWRRGRGEIRISLEGWSRLTDGIRILGAGALAGLP